MPSRKLTTSETENILSHLRTPRDRCLFLLGIKTGFRISEILSLNVGDVLGDTVTVKRCNMKGKQVSRSVPLHALVKEALGVYMQDCINYASDDKLFNISRRHANRILGDAARRAGITGPISTHCMRKTFGMYIYEASGHNVVMAQRALGHKSLSSTTHYLSVDADELKALILKEGD